MTCRGCVVERSRTLAQGSAVCRRQQVGFSAQFLAFAEYAYPSEMIGSGSVPKEMR